MNPASVLAPVLTVAAKEFRDGLRNRWVAAIAIVCALLAVGLATFGAAASGQVGFTGLATTIASLASLAVFLIPLIALLLAYDSIVGEDEQGTLLLLLTYPLSRLQLLAGKFLGHGAILAVSTTLGFGLAGLVIGIGSDKVATGPLVAALGLFIVSATLLGWAFVGIAYVISAGASEKSRAAGLALVVWFAFVLVFDLGLLGFLVATGGAIGRDWLPWLLLLNPADVFRILNVFSLEDVRTLYGLTSVVPPALARPWLMGLVMVAWIAGPLALARWRFKA